MKRKFFFLCCFILVLALLAGCAGGGTGSGAGESADPGTTADTTSSSDSGSGGISLTDMRKAAEASGFTVTDDYVNFLTDVKDGFSVQIVADGQDVIYSVLECETEDAAEKNAKEIDDAGYSIAIRSGRYLTSYGADNKDGEVKDILAALLNGEAVKGE